MMPAGQFLDSRGIGVTAGNRALVDQLERAAGLFHGYYADPFAAIEQALERDPGFIMGLAFKGGLLATSSEKAANDQLGDVITQLRKRAPAANQRERGHIAALEAWHAGRFDAAAERWGRTSFDHPRDLLALQFAHLCDFYLGQSLMLRDRPARALHAWDRAVPGYGYLLGMHAFGLEEAGHYAEAENTGREALALNARDPWAVHAVTHVMEMQNRVGDGISWLEGRSGDWADGNLFAFHNWWHLALFLLDRGDFAGALALYDTRLRPKPSVVVLEMLDASALLWRLRLRDAEVGARWEELADSWTPLIEDGFYAFNDVHAAMALVGAGRNAQVRQLVATLERVAAASSLNGRMTRDVGLPAVRALLAFGERRYADALEALLPALPAAQCVGGSHAQRDVLHLTAFEAALRAGDTSAARALVSQRLAAKPASAHNRELAKRCGLG